MVQNIRGVRDSVVHNVILLVMLAMRYTRLPVLDQAAKVNRGDAQLPFLRPSISRSKIVRVLVAPFRSALLRLLGRKIEYLLQPYERGKLRLRFNKKKLRDYGDCFSIVDSLCCFRTTRARNVSL